jgi:hypothetical protein
MKKNILLLLCTTGQVCGTVASKEANSMTAGVETVSQTQAEYRAIDPYTPENPPTPVDPMPTTLSPLITGGPDPMPIPQTGGPDPMPTALHPVNTGGLDPMPIPATGGPDPIPVAQTGGPDPLPTAINPILKPAIKTINMKTLRKKLKSMNCEIVEAIFANKIAPNVRYIVAPQINVTDKVKAVFQTDKELRIKRLMQNAIKNKKLSAKQQELINGGNRWALALFFEVNYNYGTLYLQVRMTSKEKSAKSAKIEEYMINLPDNMLKIKQAKAKKESSSTSSSDISQTQPILIDAIDLSDDPEAIDDAAPELQ